MIKNFLSYAVDNEALKLANKIVKSDEWIRECSAMNQNTEARNPNGMVVSDEAPKIPESYGQEEAEESDEEFDLK